MTEKYIQFKKQRDLGEIISDTFRFIRENYKLLFKLILRVAGPVFLVLVLVLGLYSYLGGESFSNTINMGINTANEGWFLLSFILLMLSLLLFYVLLYGVILNYIKSYIEHQGDVIENEVIKGVQKDFGSLLGLFLVAGALLALGLMLCVLPGIYLWVPLSLSPAALIFGKHSIANSVGETFHLIKDNWWITFLSLLVIAILVYIISMIFQMPMIIYYFFKALTMVEEGSVADPSDLFDWVYVVFNVISSLAQYLLSTVMVVATAFIFYNLNEIKHFTGSFETIANLGSSEKK